MRTSAFVMWWIVNNGDLKPWKPHFSLTHEEAILLKYLEAAFFVMRGTAVIFMRDLHGALVYQKAMLIEYVKLLRL